jgi:hypothetical protein
VDLVAADTLVVWSAVQSLVDIMVDFKADSKVDIQVEWPEEWLTVFPLLVDLMVVSKADSKVVTPLVEWPEVIWPEVILLVDMLVVTWPVDLTVDTKVAMLAEDMLLEDTRPVVTPLVEWAVVLITTRANKLRIMIV